MKSLTLLSLLIFCSHAFSQDKELFKGLIKEIIQNDPSFKEVDLRTPVYDAQYYQGISQLILPKIGISYGQYDQNNSAAFIAEDKYRVGSLTASFSLFSFGSDLYNFQYTRIERKAQDQRVITRLLERESELTTLVLTYIKEARNLEILKKLVELKEKALAVSLKRYQRGNLSEEDYNKVKLDVSNARGELMVTQQTFNFTLAQVKAFGVEKLPLGYPWEEDLTPAKIEKLQDLVTPVSELPQFRAAELTEDASDYRKEALRNIMFGQLQLNFSRSFYDFQQENMWEWRTGLVYTLPLFDSFDQYVNYKSSDAQQRINEVKKRFERNASAARQEAEKVNLLVSLKNWIERREALKLSSRLYTGSLNQFNQGKLSVNELFVDQDRLLRTELIANLALHQMHTSVLAYCHSQGKAFIQGCF